MKRWLLPALATATAPLAFGCSSLDEPMALPGYERPDCTPLGRRESEFFDSPGYRSDECNGFERMRFVTAIEIDDLPDPTSDASERPGSAEYGKAQQPITVHRGDVDSVGLPISPNSNFTNWSLLGDTCPYSIDWSVAQPIRGHCIVPGKVTFKWSICPNCYHEGYFGPLYYYLLERFDNAWRSWLPGQSMTGCDGNTYTNHFLYDAEKLDIDSGGDGDYGSAELAIYPSWDMPDNVLMQWGTSPAYLTHYSQTPGGVRYHGWNFSELRVNHHAIEDVATDLCNFRISTVGAAEFSAGMARAYEGAMAHELGHAFGFPHSDPSSSGVGRLMRRRASCDEIFGAVREPGPAYLTFATFEQNSSGVNLTLLPASIWNTCQFPGTDPTAPGGQGP